ncbi:TY1 enhancer activator [Pseudozyma hubeiensis]|nr:TY1 enhancer activator [Pseudozyma hubeiensis]
MPSSPHPCRSAAHQLQHPDHASYSPSPRAAPLYVSSARSSHVYRSASNASSPEAFSENDLTRKVPSDYLGTSSRVASSSRAPTAGVYDAASSLGPSPTKRRKQSADDSPVISAAASSPHSASKNASANDASDPNAIDSKASTRVAKACQPCSTKKRRCDGRQPECSVCQVLGTPCTYNHTGLKRGPPKGFRSGPKESARAKLVRTLETTIRDLVNHLGKEDAGAEIVRVSGERHLPIGEASVGEAEYADATTSSKRSRAKPDRASSRIKIEHLTSSDSTGRFNDSRDSDGGDDDPAAEAEEDVIGETRQGELVYRGSSSGIGILQRQHRAESPTAANRSVGSSSSVPFGPRSRDNRLSGEGAVHTKAPVFLPISSPRPTGDAETVSSHDRSPRPSKTTPRREMASLYPGTSRDGHTSTSHVSAEDPVVSDEENDRLFRYYWQGFHPFYPILYKPWFVGFSRQELRNILEPSLLFAIYAIGACVVPGSASQGSSGKPDDSAHKLNLERAQLFCQAAESHVLAKGLRPDIASIQTCWLLSLYSHGTGDLSRAWNFQNLASSMAVDLGLHRWPIYRPEIVQDRVQRETRIRVIWHCYIVDKLLCAEMGRPVGLRAKDIDVPLLSETEEDEFELWSDQTEMQSADQQGGVAGPVRRLHAPSCLNWGVHLFKIVERILDEVHSLRRKALLRKQGKEQVLTDLDRQLTEWKEKLPAHLHLDDSTHDGPFPSFFALNLWYYTARLLLHRPFIPQDEGLAMSKVLENDSHRQSTLAANTICDLLEASSRDIVDRLSTDLGYCLFTAAVMFVFNARLPDLKIATDARRRYGLCVQWLKKLADTWPAASAHRLLLDGFAVVGEDASKQAADAQSRRRPSIAALQAANAGTPGMGATFKVSNWIAETEGALQGSSNGQPGQSSAAKTNEVDNQMLERQGQGGAQNTYDNVPFSTNNWNNFAPGIFDVESFFWNENATNVSALMGMQFNQTPATNAQGVVPQQQGVQGVPYGGFNGGIPLGGGAGAGYPIGSNAMQNAPMSTTAPAGYPVSGYTAQQKNNVLEASQQQPPMQTQMQSGVSMQPPQSAQTAAASEQPFNTSPFAFNATNSSIGEFWSMLELPPAFLQQ